MDIWIPVTIAAAFLQNVRSALQKHLKSAMGTTGATFVRFGFGVPFAFLYLAALALSGRPLPVPTPEFLGWTIIGGAAQIAATFLLVHLFSFRNFTVGTAYSRTEPAQAALLALILFGETLSWGAMLAIAISVVGVMLISVARSPFSPAALVTSVMTRTAAIGLASGTLFGLSGVAYRAAALSLAPTLPAPDPLIQAAFTLVVTIVLQAGAMLGWMTWREPDELGRIRRAWRVSALAGFVGATASFGWFFAFALQQAAVVKALAQVEMLFTLASSVLVFREHVNRLEIAGCALIVAGIIALVLVR